LHKLIAINLVACARRCSNAGDRAMSLTTVLLFSAVALVAIVTPGPTVLLALSNGSRHGLRLSCAGMAGAVASDLVLVAAAALGLGALLTASEFWFSMVKWIGVAYLGFLGLQMLRSKGVGAEGIAVAGAEAAGAAGQSTGRGTAAELGMARLSTAGRGASEGGKVAPALFRRSFLVSVTNPKGYLFVSAFLPQFIAPADPQLLQYVILAVVFAALDFAVMFAYAYTGARAVRLLRSGGARRLDRTCGALMIAAAGSLAFYRRSG
jgi:threonine/homoserine/homoserine lactone efflux protein